MVTTKEIGDRLEDFTEQALGRTLSQFYAITRNTRLGGREIDVLLTPKQKLLCPILVSCKNEKTKVEPDHVWAWSSIVQTTGAAKGIIVASAGFTSGEIDFAGNAERRVELWHCRPTRPEDFNVHSWTVQGILIDRPRILDAKLRLEAVDKVEREPQEFNDVLSAETRDLWTYRTETGDVGNLWDDINHAAEHVEPGEPRRLELPVEPRKILQRGTVRSYVTELSLVVQRGRIAINVNVNVLREFPVVFENAVTREIQPVPFTFPRGAR